MRILLYQWKTYSGTLLESNLKRMGHEVCVWSDDGITENEEASLEPLLQKLQEKYDAVFSYNYFRSIALACYQEQVIYISWMIDAPLLSLYDKSSVLETNYFFCFDSEQYRNLIQRGLEHVYYLPLGVDQQLWEATIANSSPAECKKYEADVSFVGSLYTEKDMYSEIEKSLSPYVQGYLRAYCQTQMMVPAVRFSEMMLEKDFHQTLERQIRFPDAEQYELSFDELMDNLLDRHVTVMERREMLRICQEFPGFKLYTKDAAKDFPAIANCGAVDYYKEMPKVFRYSKINLNVSLRSIRYGIPLRVLDVIASGGFLLTNAQPDLFLFFEEGKSIVTFRNLNEMKEKINYYLKHEEERREIIHAGQEIIRKNFDFQIQLAMIFQAIADE